MNAVVKHVAVVLPPLTVGKDNLHLELTHVYQLLLPN